MIPKDEDVCVAAQMLREVADVVQQRHTAYGEAVNQFQETAEAWTTITGYNFTAADVCACMMALKENRIKNGEHNMDNYIDIIGYAGIRAACKARE
jgi:dTDP-4-amino-4,6-dideoxygalactose transaminase